jgi:hypothetical protein
MPSNDSERTNLVPKKGDKDLGSRPPDPPMKPQRPEAYQSSQVTFMEDALRRNIRLIVLIETLAFCTTHPLFGQNGLFVQNWVAPTIYDPVVICK